MYIQKFKKHWSLNIENSAAIIITPGHYLVGIFFGGT